MKPALFLVALVLLFTTNTHAQMLVIADQPQAQFTAYSAANYNGNRHKRVTGIILVSAGGGAIGIGGFTVLLGAVVAYSAYTPNYVGQQQVIDQGTLHEGHVIEACGAVVGVGGIVMLVAGVSTLRSLHHSRYSVIAPKNNAVGLAYNF